MKKEFRIKKATEIDSVFGKRTSRGNSYFVVYTKENDSSHFRYAISIGKKYGNSTQRNLAKRRVRAIITKNQSLISNMLFVIVIKPKVSELPFTQFEENLLLVLNRAKIIK